MRRATVGQWASRNTRDELAHNEVRIIFSTYFRAVFGRIYIYPIYTWYIFDLFYFEFIVLNIEYIFWIFRTYFIFNLELYLVVYVYRSNFIVN